MILVDSSVWIDIFRDATGAKGRVLEAIAPLQNVALTSFTELELLQGCRDEREWNLLSDYLSCQHIVAPDQNLWIQAARIHFELRRSGKTVRSPIDCCIAQIALQNEALLLHRDRDFENIASLRPLQQQWVHW